MCEALFGIKQNRRRQNKDDFQRTVFNDQTTQARRRADRRYRKKDQHIGADHTQVGQHERSRASMN